MNFRVIISLEAIFFDMHRRAILLLFPLKKIKENKTKQNNNNNKNNNNNNNNNYNKNKESHQWHFFLFTATVPTISFAIVPAHSV